MRNPRPRVSQAGEGPVLFLERVDPAVPGNASWQRRGAPYAATGSVRWTVLPPPSALSIQMRPPWPCTMHLEM